MCEPITAFSRNARACPEQVEGTELACYLERETASVNKVVDAGKARYSDLRDVTPFLRYLVVSLGYSNEITHERKNEKT